MAGHQERRRAMSEDEIPEPVVAAAEAIAEHKGKEIRILDMREVSGFTDYLVICHGRNDRQNRAIADAIDQRLEQLDDEPYSVEGYGEGTWILADYVDFVVNIFDAETREFYQLERLWRDAAVHEYDAGPRRVSEGEQEPPGPAESGRAAGADEPA